jgi:CheY-like chemotaxis protein
MPVHPLTLSHFLNDETRSILNYNKDSLVNFTIPSARLLIVDDIATNLRVAEGLIEPYHAIIDTCLSGEKAVELVKENKYDIIFMDHMMPVMDGIETTFEIREWEREEKNKARIPVIALTANAVSGMREMFLENGFDDFLPKPIEMEKLDNILRKWIPPGKHQLKAAVETKRETAKEDFAIQIPGVDVKKGIAMTGGNPKAYLKVLEMFRTDAETRLPMLNNFAPEGSADFAAFATQVHALKSASAALGASELSETAAGLEAAGRNGDSDFIRRELPSFTASLAKLSESISEIKPEPQTGKAVLPQSAIADILPVLIALKKALVEKKQGEIDLLLEELSKETTAPDIRKAAETISDQVLMAEFEEAMKTLEKIMIL